MLSSKNRYIALDFETTGLDTHKDEAIQIGIVEINNKGKIIKEFSSLLKPNKELKELKQIVGFMTGLSLADIEKAPRIEELKTEITEFFDKNTYVIGHNIGFDMHFLNKYFPDIQIKGEIDTFHRAQNFIHFAPSYALEVLVEYLYNKDTEFVNLAQEFGLNKTLEEDSFHDALIDSKNSLLLYWYIAAQVQKLINNYPLLKTLIKQTDNNIFKEIFDENIFTNGLEKTKRTIPPLEKLAPKNTKLHINEGIDIQTFVNKNRYYIGNETFEHILKKLSTSTQNIFAFSSRQKLDLAKHYFYEIGIKNIGFAREEQTINPAVLHSFLQKEQFTKDEIMFILKYFSHHYKNIGFLELNSKKDYEIYYFLKDSKKATKYPLVLTTHGGLFSIIKDTKNTYNEYNISFFDTEQRYKSYNNYLSRPCDLYQTLNFIETLLYTYDVRNQIKNGKYQGTLDQLQSLYSFFQIFMATLFTESTKLFTKTDAKWIEYNPILENGRFHQTSILRPKHNEHLTKLKETLLEDDKNNLEKHIKHIDFILNTLVTINKRIHNQNGDFYFIFKETNKFTNRDEFTDIFEERKILFLSHSNTQYPRLTNTKKSFETKYKIYKIPNQNSIIEKLKTTLKNTEKYTIFILSSKKNESKQLFESIIQHGFQHQSNIIAENITGGVGKSIFKCKNNENNIIIGSYNFLMRMFAKKKDIDIVINFNIKGALEQFFLDDLSRYAPSQKDKK